jgi:lipoyl-dependent peroxiredoxin
VQHKKDAAQAKITCSVTIGPRDTGGFGLAVKLRIEDRRLPYADLAVLAKEAHEKICPYSNATRGDIDVQLEVVGA